MMHIRAVCVALLVLAYVAGPVSAAPPTPKAPTAAQERLVKRAKAEEGKALKALQVLDLMPAARHAALALALVERAYGVKDPRLEPFLERLSSIRGASGDYRGTISILERLLEVRKGKALVEGPAGMGAGFSLISSYDTLALYVGLTGDPKRAMALLSESRALSKVIHRDNPMAYASNLGVHAVYLVQYKAFTLAEALYDEALALLKVADATPHQDRYWAMRNQLGWMLLQRGQKERAFTVLDGVAAHYRAWTPATDYDFNGPGMLRAVGSAFQFAGETERAQALYGEAAEGYRAALKRVDNLPEASQASMRMAIQSLLQTTLGDMGANEESLASFKAAYDIAKADPKTTDMTRGMAAVQWGGALQKNGKFKAALKAYREAYRLVRGSMGKHQASSYLGLIGHLEEQLGHYRAAEKNYRALSAMFRERFGEKNHWAATYDLNIARLLWRRGKLKRARAEFGAAQDVLEAYLDLVLATGTEGDKRAILAENAWQLNMWISFHRTGMPDDPKAAKLALTAILQRKGRVLDAMTDSLAALRRRLGPAEQALLDALSLARGRLARLVTRGMTDEGAADRWRTSKTTLEKKIRAIEGKIALHTEASQAVRRPITMAAVAGALPEDAALIEFVAYEKMGADQIVAGTPVGGTPPAKERHYVAYILTAKGAASAVDLGPVGPIDAAVGPFREALKSPDSEDIEPLARALDARIMAPVRAVLGDTRTLYLAPDGALNLVPFSALRDERGQYLVQRYTFTYLTSGRDLLRPQADSTQDGTSAIVADPLFGDGGDGGDDISPRPKSRPGDTTRGLRSLDLAATQWAPLPGTAGEAKALQALLPGVTMLLGKDATEGALKAMNGPPVLHIATHGFFLPDTLGPTDADRLKTAENPLLRSGLVFSGANALSSDADDGVLTALEASGLDLWGTRLVVLSACETGLGDVRNGEGVFGLRRALVLAGAESLLITLWQVDDAATEDLIIGYYKALFQGRGRTNALRSQQLRMLRSDDFRHPYYWASFIPAGRAGPLPKNVK